MITLYTFPQVFGVLNPSPFCMKTEVILRMMGLDYRREVMANPAKAPKGKLPFIEEHGVRIADSGFILEHLKSGHGDTLNKGVTARNKAIAHTLRRMVEESLYFVLLYSRWIDDDSWPVTSAAFFGDLPKPVRAIVPPLLRRNIRKTLQGQGIGRHEPSEIYAIGIRDLEAIADILGTKDFMLGRAPTEIDATCYAILANILIPPHDTPLKRAAQRLENLSPYVARMTDKYGALEAGLPS